MLDCPLVVTCPSCRARWRVPQQPAGREPPIARCAACGHRWHLVADPATSALGLPPATPAEAPGPVPVAAARPVRARPLAVRLAGVALLALGLLTAAFVVGRDPLAEAYPALAPWYRSAGLPPAAGFGLEFRELSSERLGEGDGALLVRAEIHNRSAVERVLPRIRLALLDAAGREVEVELFDAAVRVLPPGGTTHVEAELFDAPPEAESFGVTFADP